MFCTFTSALPAVYVQCPIWLFLQFLNFVLFRYVAQVYSELLRNGSISPVLLLVSLLFITFNLRCISVVSSLYFTVFYASFFVAFISPEILTRINRPVPFSLSRIMTSGLLLRIVLSVCVC